MTQENTARTRGLRAASHNWELFDRLPRETRDFLNYAPTTITVTKSFLVSQRTIDDYMRKVRRSTREIYGKDHPQAEGYRAEFNLDSYNLFDD